MADITDQMKAVCQRHGAEYVATPPDSLVAVADNVGSGLLPLNGLRYRRGTTSGWFLWAGDELDTDSDYFKPTHARHLIDRCPEIMTMLGLGEGWRFLITPNYEDVWFDPDILKDSV